MKHIPALLVMYTIYLTIAVISFIIYKLTQGIQLLKSFLQFVNDIPNSIIIIIVAFLFINITIISAVIADKIVKKILNQK